MKDVVKSGWLSKPLGEVVEVIGGGTPSKRNPAFYGGEIPWATVRDMNVERICKTEHSITPTALKASSSKLIPAGEVVIATRVGLGKACILGQDTAINQDLRGLVPKSSEQVERRFLFHWYKSIADQVIAAGTGATVQGVKLPFIKGLPFPLPPLEEQQRIVAVLDEAFEGLARARAHAEANLQNARALFESKRRALLTANSDDWSTKTLNEVCIVERGSSPRPIKNFVTNDDDGVHWVKIGDTKVGSKYVTGTKEKITKKGAEKSRAVYVGDFILTNSMTYGRPYIMGIDGYIHDGWFVLRLKDEIDTDFFFHLLSSTVVQDQFEQLAAGSVVKNISGDLVKKAVLSLPPVAVQTVIASELDSVSNDVKRIEKTYIAKIQDIDDLRQSLLQKAFAGELT